ncbi:MAG: zinc ribbon domain-containing protein [Lachnospiraceae bacterium]|nr:zinc ribbon domain-containing protein [Lachnospiraceae bacterium]
MFCNKCGNQLPNGTKYCNKCGADLTGVLNDRLDKHYGKVYFDFSNPTVKRIYGYICDISSKVSADIRLRISLIVAVVAFILALCTLSVDHTAWIAAVSSIIIIYAILTGRHSSELILAIAVSVYTFKIFVMNTVHIFGNEDFKYPFLLVVADMVLYVICIFHWLKYSRKISEVIATVVLVGLHLFQMLYAFICFFAKTSGVTILYIYNLCWFVQQLSFLGVFTLELTSPEKIEWIEFTKSKIRFIEEKIIKRG